MKPALSPVGLLYILCGQALAAPPAVTSLFPAGGRAGATVEVAANGTFDDWPARVWSSDKAVSAVATKEKGKLTVTVAADAPPGVCWLRLHTPAGASQLRPFVVGALPEAAEVEPNDTPAKPQPMTLPVTVNGRLAKSADVDVYAVGLKRGQMLVAALSANRPLGSPMDGVLQVVAADGTVLAQNNDRRGLDPLLAFPAPADGTYLVRLFAFPAQPDSSIRHFGSADCVYRLTLTAGGFLDHVTPFAVEAGKPADLRLHGWNLPVDRFRLAADRDRVTPSGCANTGAVAREPHPCFDLTAPPAEPLAPPFTATGRVPTAAVVPVAVTKGKPLTVSVAAASLGSPLTPVVRVTDAGGKELAKAEPAQLHGDCEAAVTPAADGVVRVSVRDLIGTAGPEAAFRLRVVPVAPDFAPTVAADRLTVTPGQPLDVAVTLNPRHGFASGLRWEVEGLPPGVTVAPTGKADAKTVTLRFEAKAAGVGGPVRIIAVDAKDAARRRVVVKLADFDADTSDLWLTVAPPAAKK
ncbi:MAG: PPC domain-containing protein [Gemmataceae bacterium]